MATTAPTRRLNPNHEQILAKSGITREQAEAWGIWSCSTADGLEGTDLDHQGNRGKTGLVFPLRRIDGSITYQMRVDDHLVDDSKGVRKYAQAAGVGAIINVPATMADRVGNATKVLVVEGTKQTIAASLYAPEDTLVFGIQGARNWSSEGLPLAVLCELVRPGCEVVIAFDADWQTNPDVYAAARYLKEHFETSAGAASVRLAIVPGGAKLGVDDFLGTNPDPTSRPQMLTRLIDKATPSLGRKPAARKQAAAVKVDEALKVDTAAGRIMKLVKVANGFGEPEVRQEVALFAAAEIVASEAHVDEETGETADQMLTLQVYVPISGQDEPSKFLVKVKSSKLADVGSWLDRLPRGIGVSIPRSTKPDDDVANAIRAYSTSIESVTVVSHTGWTFDVDSDTWRWLDGAGAIGPEDKVKFLRGEPASNDFRAINLPAPAQTEAERKRVAEHVRSLVWAREHFNDDKKFNWDVGLAAWGLSFTGVTPLAALCYFGPPASGKSTIAQTLASTVNPTWAPNGAAMSTFNARPAGMDLLPDGLRNCFLHVDDLKPEADTKKRADALAAFDALLRRAHGSGGAVRGTVDKVQDRLGVRKVDGASPMMIITGEEIPTGEGFAESGLDRALFIPVMPKTQLRDEKALSALTRLASSGNLTHATTSYIQWLAARINDPDAGEDGEEIPAEKRFDAWRNHLDAQRQTINSNDNDEDDLSIKKRLPEEFNVSNRARMLVASLCLGYQNVLEWAMDTGVVSDDEAEELWEHFVSGIIKAILAHTREVMGGNATPSEQALAALRNAVSSRKVTLDENEMSNKPLVGEIRASNHPQRVSECEGTAVIINHAAAAEALRWPGGARAMQRALAGVAVANSNGQTTRTLTLNGARVQCMVISEEVWGKVDTPSAAEF